MSDNEVLAIAEGRRGLWVGTAAGLNLFDGKNFTVFTTRDGLSNDSVWALLEDRAGDLWIGTDGGGLNRFRDGAFYAYKSGDGFSSDIVLSLYEDRAGDLWIGTSGGLSRYRNGQFTSYTTREGLFDDVIFQILEDDSDNLWMSCNKGVFRVSKSELNDFAEGKRKSITSVSYGTADGMSSRECNGGIQPAGWKSRDGRLWFPTIKGAVVIDPNKLRINEQPPPVTIEQVIVDGQATGPSADLRLEPGARRLEFHYAGLSFLSSEKVRFKHKLEGYDNEWIDAGTRREAIYNNLAPGSYVFRVVACNNDGVWNEAGASFGFYLKPRFYQTYWFYLACALAISLLVWALYRLRIRQIRARFLAVLAERNRIAREIHDTLAQGFVGIGLQLEAVKANLVDPTEAARQHLDLAGNLVAHSLEEAHRTVWNLRSQSLEDGPLSEALSTIMKQLTEGARIEARMKVSGAERRLPIRVETHLLRIGQEAIINAVKHARAQNIEVELRFDAESVTLRVRDDGRGFDVETAPSTNEGHFGLTGMRERAKQIGGRLQINSTKGMGAEIALTVSADRRMRDEQR
jgi:signal transduction histidine kinase